MKQIRLTKGLYALVSDKDFSFLKKLTWQASIEGRGTKFYARTTWYGKTEKMHKLVMYRIKNSVLVTKGLVVDHLNHNSLDNRRCNLELITQAENMRRSKGWRKKGEKYR